MKRTVGCIVLFIIVSWLPVCAQNNMKLSLEAGPNVANVEQENAKDFNSLYDFGNHLGVHLQYQVTKKVQLYTGVGFSEIHFNREYTTNQFGYGQRLPDLIRLPYQFKSVDIPLGVRYSIPLQIIDIEFSLGVKPIFVSGERGETYSKEDGQGLIQVEVDISNEINSFSMLGEIGTELRYHLAESTSVYGGIRYGYSLSKIYESENSSGQLSRFDILVGLSFNLF